MVQRVCRSPAAPDTRRFRTWASAAYRAAGAPLGAAELTVRIVEESEARALNRAYRNKDYVPNVLSFAMGPDEPVPTGLLGDVVICAPVVEREANEQGKPPKAHWCHLVVHGVLHCCGFRHDTRTGAARMECLERRILAEFGFADPYTVVDEQ